MKNKRALRLSFSLRRRQRKSHPIFPPPRLYFLENKVDDVAWLAAVEMRCLLFFCGSPNNRPKESRRKMRVDGKQSFTIRWWRRRNCFFPLFCAFEDNIGDYFFRNCRIIAFHLSIFLSVYIFGTRATNFTLSTSRENRVAHVQAAARNRPYFRWQLCRVGRYGSEVCDYYCCYLYVVVVSFVPVFLKQRTFTFNLKCSAFTSARIVRFIREIVNILSLQLHKRFIESSIIS